MKGVYSKTMLNDTNYYDWILYKAFNKKHLILNH